MTKLELSLQDIDVDPSSYVDPQGFVFRYQGTIYRCIYADAALIFSQLIDDGRLAKWQENYGVVETQKANIVLREYQDALIVQHRLIAPMTYCVEWCPSMLRDAALSITELAVELADHNFSLQDAYPWNIAFEGPTPRYLDLTSIAPASPTTIWQAYDQFRAFFLRPLALSASGNSRIARALLLDNIGGITLDEFYRACGARYLLQHPSVSLEYGLNTILKRRENVRRSLTKDRTGSKRFEVTPQIRKRFLKKLDKNVRSYKPPPTLDLWKAYYDEIPAKVDTKAKIEAIDQILEKLKPPTVVDLGCNTGLFSILAANQGAKTISIDLSESCVEHLYGYAKQNNLEITPIVSHLACPTPPFGFMGEQFPGLLERARSHTVLCLAVMHHLHITARQSFDRIAKLVSAVARKNLVFEFVAIDDANNALLPMAREINYSLETVIQALEVHFPKIDILPSDRPTRKLLLCQK